MAAAKTKPFEVFETITATTGGATKTIDLNTFVNVAEMEAFGVESIEIGVDATDTTPGSSEFMAQVALVDLSGGFISHADYDSLFCSYTEVPTGFREESLSLGDVAEIRYVPGGQLQVRVQETTGGTSLLYVRITGKISKLSAKDYMSLALTQSLSDN